MNDEDRQKLLQAEFYEKELKENQISVDALIALLEHEGNNHPQYSQLTYLKSRNQEITDQLTNLNKIINKLRNKVERI
jgi:hypothetical protein